MEAFAHRVPRAAQAVSGLLVVGHVCNMPLLPFMARSASEAGPRPKRQRGLLAPSLALRERTNTARCKRAPQQEDRLASRTGVLTAAPLYSQNAPNISDTAGSLLRH